MLRNNGSQLFPVTGDDPIEDPHPIFRVAQRADIPGEGLSDDLHLGPFYNYARLRTWSFFAMTLARSYEIAQTNELDAAYTATVERLTRGLLRLPRQANGIQQGTPEALELQQNGDGPGAYTPSRYDFLHPSRGGSGCFERSWKAFAGAFILQGLTGWSSFMIAYNTPTVGIGCRAFGFLLYNTLSLLACIMVLVGSYLSDWQNYHAHRNARLCARWIGWAEWFFRNMGKCVAVLNVSVIIISCFLQFSGVFNNCYCGSDKIGLGSRAYIVFLSATEKEDIAAVSWRAGFAMAIVACILTIIYLEIKNRDLFRRR